MITFEHLNKADFQILSSEIFNILADNMTIIAPTSNSELPQFVQTVQKTPTVGNIKF